MARDPVCKSEVDERTAAYTTHSRGKTYYFCCAACKQQFNASPESYVTGAAAGQAHLHGSSGESQAQEATETTRNGPEAGSIFAYQKDRAAEGLGRMASAFRRTADTLYDENQGAMARYAERVAKRMEGASEYIRKSDIDDLLQDAGRFIQKQPGLTLAGAFAMGFLFARFLKSSSEPAYRTYE